MSTLTDEQKKRIEENRKKALEIRAAKMREAANKSANGPKEAPQKSSFYSQGAQQKSAFNSQKGSFYSQGAKQNSTFTSGTKENSFYNRSISYKPFSSNQLNKPNDKQTKLYTQLKNDSHSASGGNVAIKTVLGSCCLADRCRFMVDAPYHQQMIEVFKTMPSKSYEATERRWYFKIEDHQRLMSSLDQLRPHVSIAPLPRNVLKILNRTKEKEKDDVELCGIDPVLENALMPFQREGVCCGVRRDGKILIADDMGLGKTIQGLALAHYYKSEWPLLIVAPCSVRYSWVSAVRQWLPSIDRSSIGVINNSKEPMDSYDIVIISWDLLSKRLKELKDHAFLTVILDESHFMKNYKSARAKAAMEVCSKARRRILLSGTPALSRPLELHTQIQAVKPSVFPNFQDYGIRYCAGKKNAFGWDYSGCAHMTELQIILEEEVMIRRLKSDVITQLPEKQRQMIVLDPSSIKSNTREMKSFSSQMVKEGQSNADKRSTLLQYFSETAVAKLPAVREYLLDLLESGKKVLCFAHHQWMLNGLAECLDNKNYGYIRIDGKTTSEQRKGMADRFQVHDEIKVALLSITAASTGITLTAASMVLFAELFWNPGVLCQAEDRAHRIGQRDCVIVQYLVGSSTADDYLWPLVQKKLDVLNKAGLSKDNFYKADAKNYKSSSARSITDYFKVDESIFEDVDESVFEDAMISALEDAEEEGNEAKKMKL